MSNNFSRLRFNFGFMLEASLGTSRVMELDYPTIRVSEDVTLTPLQGKFTATRTSEGVYVNGRFHSAIQTECVRCLEDTLVPITLEMDELFYYPPEAKPQNEDAFAFDGETGFIDLGPLMRELSLGLCMECGQNLNEGNCNCKDDDLDPRMTILRSLLE